MDITRWLEEFKSAWINHDVDRVVSLFTEDVEYWENPYKLLSSYTDLKSEWQSILKQNDIQIKTNIVLSSDNTHIVLWDLAYTDQSHNTQNWAGTYIIKLNNIGKCYYFHHTGEKKN